MPAAVVAKLAESTDIDIAEAEKRWSRAKAITTEEKGLTDKDGDAFWQYVTGVFKRSMGIGAVMESALDPTIRVIEDDGMGRMMFSKKDATGKSIGLLTVSRDRTFAADVIVPQGHRRKGIATELYNAAEKYLGHKLRPSGQQTDEAKAFWADRSSKKAVLESATTEEIHAAAHEAATSHLNDLPQPTQAQLEAGNYRKGRIRLHGLDIVIENPKGSTRSGVDPDGTPWECVIPAHYGDLKQTLGADGDAFDVYVGDHPESELVFVVDQISADTGKFDEHKGILGCLSQKEARDLYIAGFSDGKGAKRLGAMTALHMPDFKKWLREGDTTKPLSDAVLESAGAKEPWEMTRDELAGHVSAWKELNGKISMTFDGKPFGSPALQAKAKTQDPDALFFGAHEDVIRQALEAGKPVPKEVLAEYPLLTSAEKAGLGQFFTLDEAREAAKRSPDYWKALMQDATTFDGIRGAFAAKWPEIFGGIDAGSGRISGLDGDGVPRNGAGGGDGLLARYRTEALHPTAQAEVQRIVEALQKDFQNPHLTVNMGAEKGNLGDVNQYFDHLQLADEYAGKSLDEINGSYKPDKTLSWVTAHEYAHVIDGVLRNSNEDYAAYERAIGKLRSLQSRTELLVTGYAATSKKEWTAEMFAAAAIRGEDASPIAKQVYATMLNFYSKAQHKSHEERRLSQRAARDAREARVAAKQAKSAPFDSLEPAQQQLILDEVERQMQAVVLSKDAQGNLLSPTGKISKLNEHLYRAVRTPWFKEWAGDWENDQENATKVLDPETGEPMPTFHGTTADYNEYDFSKTGENTKHPTAQLGMFLTNDPSIPDLFMAAKYNSEAERRAIAAQNKVVREMAQLAGYESVFHMEPHSPERKAIHDAGAAAFKANNFANGSNILPLFASIKKPLVLTWDEWFKAADWVAGTSEDGMAAIRDKIQTGAHDGIVLKAQLDRSREYHGDTFIVFRGQQVKSTIGNVGTFSADKSNITESATSSHFSP